MAKRNAAAAGAPAAGFVRDYPLTLVAEADAVVLHASDHNQRSFVGGCVYDASGALIEESCRPNEGDSVSINSPFLSLTEQPERINGEHVYGGIMFGAFGHFLLESTSRLWALISDRTGAAARRLVYSANGPTVAAQLEQAPWNGYIRVLLETVGLPLANVTLAARAPLRVERLIVPRSTISIKNYVHPDFTRFFDHALDYYGLSDPAPQSPRRIYLSRSRLSVKRRRAANEVDIERIADAAGFEIVHPQRLPFIEQMALIRGADVIAGCDGSALHMSVFARRGTMILNLDSRRSATQQTIEAVKGLRGRRIPVMLPSEGSDARATNPRLGAVWKADLGKIERAFAEL